MKAIKFKQSLLSAGAIFMMAIMAFPVLVKADNSLSSTENDTWNEFYGYSLVDASQAVKNTLLK